MGLDRRCLVRTPRPGYKAERAPKVLLHLIFQGEEGEAGLPNIILGAWVVLAFLITAASAAVSMLPGTKPAARKAALQVFKIAWPTFAASAGLGVLRLHATGVL